MEKIIKTKTHPYVYQTNLYVVKEIHYIGQVLKFDIRVVFEIGQISANFVKSEQTFVHGSTKYSRRRINTKWQHRIHPAPPILTFIHIKASKGHRFLVQGQAVKSTA